MRQLVYLFCILWSKKFFYFIINLCDNMLGFFILLLFFQLILIDYCVFFQGQFQKYLYRGDYFSKVKSRVFKLYQIFINCFSEQIYF